MKKNTKYLLAGGVVAAGIGYWWWTSNQHQVAAAQIVSQPPLTPVSQPTLVVAPSASIPVTASATSGLTASQQSELSALMAWTSQSANPALYQQMMQQLTGSQIDNLYSILTTQWEVTGAVPTAAHTAFWNQLRQQFPFLNNGGLNAQGQLCQNLNCT
jgi:hypothetical protein